MIKFNDNNLIIEWQGTEHVLASSKEEFLGALDDLVSMVGAGALRCLESPDANCDNVFGSEKNKLSMSYVDGNVIELGFGKDKFVISPVKFIEELRAELKSNEDSIKKELGAAMDSPAWEALIDEKFEDFIFSLS